MSPQQQQQPMTTPTPTFTPLASSMELDQAMQVQREYECKVEELRAQLRAQSEYTAKCVHELEEDRSTALVELARLKGKMKVQVYLTITIQFQCTSKSLSSSHKCGPHALK